jgi:Uma2 family endonuclease
MERLRPSALTADEFIVWAMERPDGRFELDSGTVVAMAPERVNHARAKRNITIAFHNAIGARGLGCEALPDGASVRVNDCTVYEPDALVRCGPPSPGDAVEVNDPIIVVEVVSPSSRGVDTGSKLASYFSLPSVRHYLIIDTERRTLIHHYRDERDIITVGILRDGALSLEPPGLTINIPDIFIGI